MSGETWARCSSSVEAVEQAERAGSSAFERGGDARGVEREVGSGGAHHVGSAMASAALSDSAGGKSSPVSRQASRRSSAGERPWRTQRSA